MPADPGWSAERVLDALIGALEEVVLLFDADHRCRGAGARARVLFGDDVAEMLGAPRKDLLRRLAASADDAAAFVAAVEAAWSVPQLIELSRPERRQVLWRTVPVAAGGQPVGLVDIVRDVTVERSSALQVEEMAKAIDEVTTVDPVTGLLNQRSFLDDLDREHRRAQRVWEPYAVVRLDVNGMAELNVALGWSGGDALLRRIGEELRKSRREYDLVGRWEADEFIVCLPGADAPAAKSALERVLSGLRERVRGAVGCDVALSVGLAVWAPPSSDGPSDMVQRAGAALDAARRDGRGEIAIDAREGTWKDAPVDE